MHCFYVSRTVLTHCFYYSVTLLSLTQVVCGHKPIGDVPMVIQDATGITIVDADTTYSANVLGIDAQKVEDPVLFPHQSHVYLN